MAKLKALVVEDDVKFMKNLGNFLKVGFHCDAVLKFSGSEAINALDKEHFHVLLLDLKMPGIDGFTVLAHAKKVNPEIIIIVISGILDSAITKRAEQMGAWYMAKPIQLKVLEHILKDSLKNIPSLRIN